MSSSNYAHVDAQFSKFSFERTDCLTDCPIEEIAPHSKAVTMADLNRLASSLLCTSLDQPSLSTRNQEVEALPQPQPNSFQQTRTPHTSTSTERSQPNTLKRQRRSVISSTSRSHPQNVSEFVQEWMSQTQPPSRPITPLERPVSPIMDAVLECDENDNESLGSLMEVLKPIKTLSYRRSREMNPDICWIEKPIRVRRHRKRT